MAGAPLSLADEYGGVAPQGRGHATAIAAAAIAEQTASEGVGKMKKEVKKDEVQIDRPFVGVIVRRIHECSGSPGSDRAPGQTHPFGPT